MRQGWRLFPSRDNARLSSNRSLRLSTTFLIAGTDSPDQPSEIVRRVENRTLEVRGDPPRLHQETKSPRRDTRRFCFRRGRESFLARSSRLRKKRASRVRSYLARCHGSRRRPRSVPTGAAQAAESFRMRSRAIIPGRLADPAWRELAIFATDLDEPARAPARNLHDASLSCDARDCAFDDCPASDRREFVASIAFVDR